MAFLVEISPSALNDAEAAFLRKQREDPAATDNWFNGLLDAVYSLEKFPNRFPLAPEGKEMGIGLRNLLYSKTHRILFVVVDRDEAGDLDGVVQVLRIRHYRQALLTTSHLVGIHDSENTHLSLALQALHLAGFLHFLVDNSFAKQAIPLITE